MWVEKNTIKSHFIHLFKKNSRVCSFPVSLGYMVSSSWSPKQFRVCVSSREMSLKLNQTLANYCHKFSAIIARVSSIPCRQDRLYVDQRFCGWKNVYISLWVACRAPSHMKDPKTWGCIIKEVSTSLASPIFELDLEELIQKSIKCKFKTFSLMWHI